MEVSRLRWGLGALLAALSIVAALRALGAYLDHRLWLGSAAVLLLAIIAVAGMVSLGKARLRLERELAGLTASPPAGEWIATRRARLEAVRAAGATLDVDAIATATAAEERGQAYLGRYLVAVTVLVGLVGTFAGLMETLRGVAPLLRDDRLSTAQALALPLAGLDVTFGASVVGILVTLALALVQGDLVLAEERALARLEEATAHVLVPAIWPAATRPEERVAAEVAALRSEVRQALAAAGQATTERVAAQTRLEIERLVAATRETLERVAAASVEGLQAARATSETATAALERSVAEVASALRATADSTSLATRESAHAVSSSVAASADAATRALAASASEAHRTAAAATAALERSVGDAAGALRATADSASSAARESAQTVAAAVAASTEAAMRALADGARDTQRTVAAAAEAVQRALADVSARSHTANDALAERAAALVTHAHAQALAASAASAAAADAQLRTAGAALLDAAAGLRASAGELGGSLATLGPELAALAREVALLAARDDGAGSDQVVGEELVRLGDGLERLEALLVRERGRQERA
jgi:hypothetical protein